MRRFYLSAFLILILVVCTSTSGLAAAYDFATIDVPGAASTFVHGINDNGQMVGGFVTDELSGRTKGFLFSKGRFTTLDAPTADSTTALGINNSGHVVGTFTANEQLGFLLKKNGKRRVFKTIDVNVPDAGVICMTQADAINNRGEIVGQYLDHCDTGNGQHGFLYDGRVFTAIDVPASNISAITGVNDSGAVVGYYEDATSSVLGFIRTSAGQFTAIDGAFPLGINNAGQIVGYYIDGITTRGFLSTVLTADDFSPIDFPGAIMTVATGINKSGQIVGWYFDDTGTHGFIAKPIVQKKKKKKR
jgi:uncharacterized membrane protein